MFNVGRFLGLALTVMFVLGCQSMGSNTSYLIKYKKDLRGYYAERIKANQLFPSTCESKADSELTEGRAAKAKCNQAAVTAEDKKRCESEATVMEQKIAKSKATCLEDAACAAVARTEAKAICRKNSKPQEITFVAGNARTQEAPKCEMSRHTSWAANEAEQYLPSIYSTNLPLSLTDHYDTRWPERKANDKVVSQGDPINIIINKVHLANNAEWLCGKSTCIDTAEIAVVVTVDDGKQDEPQNVLVAYEEGLKRDIDLPIANLLAYANNAYDNEPIRINVTVFEFDKLENESFKKMLGTAAGIGAAMTPAYAPAWSMATQVGNFLINQNQDDIVVKFTFQVYPRTASASRSNVADLGVPPIQSGTYFVLNTNEARDVGEVTRRIHLDYGLNAFEIEEPKVTSGEKVLDCDLTLREWPIPQSATTKISPLNESYVVLTLAKAPTRSAALIIDRLNILNRKATGLANVEARSQAGAALLARDLDDVRSAVTWFFTEGEYMRRKADPRALAEVIAIAEDPRLVEADKTKAVALVHRSLPTMSREFKESNGITAPAQEVDLSNLKKWYDTVKSQAVYDPIKGRMMCKDEAGDEKSCH